MIVYQISFEPLMAGQSFPLMEKEREELTLSSNWNHTFLKTYSFCYGGNLQSRRVLVADIIVAFVEQ